MNKADQERLLELKIHVWAAIAKQLINPDKDPDEIADQGTLSRVRIELKRNRIDKAIRMLTDAGVIELVKGIKDKDLQRYKILKFDEANAVSVKPVFDPFWSNHMSDVNTSMFKSENNTDTLNNVGYKSITMFNEAEQIYIYYHPEEFDVYVWERKYSNSDDVITGKEYYSKELLEFRNKMVLKCLVERELLVNFPKYLQSNAEYSKEVISASDRNTFHFRKYAVSSVFLLNEINGIFQTYEEHTNKINLLMDAFNKTNAWVDSVGGFEEAIKFIRKQIINDYTANLRRFDVCAIDADMARASGYDEYNASTITEEYDTRFKYINEHLDLFNYATLYEDPALKGSEVLNLAIVDDRWNSGNQVEGGFDEQEDEGDDI